MQNKEVEPIAPKVEYMEGERGYKYAVQDSVILLPVDSASTQYEVRLYQGKEGLMLESPKILQNTLFGIRSNESGSNMRIKENFTYIGKVDNMYQYCYPYFEMTSYYGAYIINNLDYCWIVYTQENIANRKADIIEFSPAEFGLYFDNVKAHFMN